MKKIKFFLPIFMTIFILLGNISQASDKTKVFTPKVIALKFHADWCGTCKKLDPVFDKIKKDYSAKPVLFIKFDFTDDTTTHQSDLLASTLNISKLYQDNQGTGFVILLNNKHQEVGRLTVENNYNDMKKTLDKALKS